MTLYENKGITTETKENRQQKQAEQETPFNHVSSSSGSLERMTVKSQLGGRSNGRSGLWRPRASNVYILEALGWAGAIRDAARTRKHSQIYVCNGNESRKLAANRQDRLCRVHQLTDPSERRNGRQTTGEKALEFDRVGIWSRDRHHPRRDATLWTVAGGSAHASTVPAHGQWPHATVAGERRRRRSQRQAV